MYLHTCIAKKKSSLLSAEVASELKTLQPQLGGIAFIVLISIADKPN